MQKAMIMLSSVTYAIRGQKLLEREGIRSTVKKIARSLQANGCGYGLEINAADLDTAVNTINSAGIRITEITR